jgi:general secretion pathway protein I
MNIPLTHKGFTLLEVMVTLSIMAIALISLFDLQIQTLSMNMETRFNACAPYLAKKKLAEFEMTPLGEISPGAGDFADEYPGFTWTLETEDVQPEVLKTTRLSFKKMDLHVGFSQNEWEYRLRAYRLIQE